MSRWTRSQKYALALLFLMSSKSFCRSEAQRPFRLGMISLNRNIDSVKPLAESDTSGPLIRGQVIYGGYDSKKIHAFNMETHKDLWWQSTEGEVTNPLLMVENTIYLSNRSGQVMSLNALTGERNWQTNLDAYCERPFSWSNGVLYAITAGQVVYAIDGLTGKRLWVHDAGFPDSLVVRRAPAPVVHDGRIIVGLSSGELLALKIEDGKQLWRYNPLFQESRFKDIIGDMVVHSGRLLISRNDGLIAYVDVTQERQVIWQDRQTSASTSTFRAGRFYVGLTAGEVLSYDGSTGRINWRSQIGVTPAFMIASESNLYVIGSNGRVSALSISTGEYQWGDQLGSRIASPPSVAADRMYVATGLHNLYGYKIQ